MPRVYVAGWIKRGPIRVIGTNGRMRWPACARCSGTPPLTPCSKRLPQTLPRCRARFLLEKRFRSSRSGTATHRCAGSRGRARAWAAAEEVHVEGGSPGGREVTCGLSRFVGAGRVRIAWNRRVACRAVWRRY